MRLCNRQLSCVIHPVKLSREAACIAIVLALESMEPKKKRKRKVWMKDWLKKRHEFTHDNLLQELVISSSVDYKNFLRMDKETFIDLLGMVMPLIRKVDTKLRDAISASEWLSSTLRFLATGQLFEDLKFTTAISAQSLGHIIIETCSAIVSVLKESIKVGVIIQKSCYI